VKCGRETVILLNDWSKGKNDGGLRGKKDSRRAEEVLDTLRDTALHCSSVKGLDILWDIALLCFGS